MQLLPRYLVSNKINIVANLAGFVTEYRPVYKRQVQVYKGIDNVLEFKLLNVDQKPINTQGYTPKFRAFDENNNLVIEANGSVLDDGSTATRGLFTVTITDRDTINLKDQFLSYNVFLIDNSGDSVLTYTDTHFGADSYIKLSSALNPGPKESKIVTTFNQVGSVYISSAVDAEVAAGSNEALHTIAFYTNEYIGNIDIQVTLENQITESTTWTTVNTLTFTQTELSPTPANVIGVFSFIRFVCDSDPSNISKILIRN